MNAPAIAAMVSRLAAVRRAEVYADHASGQYSDPACSTVLGDAELGTLPPATYWCALAEIERLGRQCCARPDLAPHCAASGQSGSPGNGPSRDGQ